MRKLLAILLGVMMMVIMAGCGDSATSKSPLPPSIDGIYGTAQEVFSADANHDVYRYQKIEKQSENTYTVTWYYKDKAEEPLKKVEGVFTAKYAPDTKVLTFEGPSDNRVDGVVQKVTDKKSYETIRYMFSDDLKSFRVSRKDGEFDKASYTKLDGDKLTQIKKEIDVVK